MADFLHGVEVIEIDDGLRPIQSIATGIIGVVGTAPGADPDAFPLNTPVLIAGSRREAAKLWVAPAEGQPASPKGTLPAALDGIFDQAGAVVVVVRVAADEDEEGTLANIIGGTNATTGDFEGVHALLGAEAAVGVRPRILIAPGFTHQILEADTANPVAAEMLGIADRMRAVVLIDGPNTTDAAAISAAGAYGSPRAYIIDPWVKVLDSTGAIVVEPASARVAGLIAKTDAEVGVHQSPSNRPINGILGTARAVDFTLGDASSRANLLNEANVATIIRQDGFRLWGNRSLSSDPKWQFLCVRRTADLINDSLQRAHLWAVDRAITRNYADDVSESVNAYLASLQAQGVIIGGRCWVDPDLNTPATLANGEVYFDFDFTAPYPAEHITFRSRLTTDYLEEMLA
ncbi:phage tail sheath subtilisin-like domain-containing protein [uncultured Paracoccus sp.]|uniref:phage tail sheath subtilisin-like domain-containing protein n=1 Tax=uncultured Paracoccus sp. TaxID=189685 RepID=UPI0025EB7913|nr:phage tail sheath subtilisin-like domain-containing protein [uncultured Paracoccus sp.]